MDAQPTAADPTVNPPVVNSSRIATADGGGSLNALPETMFVLDTTAIPLTGHDQEDRAKGRGPRTHVMRINGVNRTYTFKPHEPLEMPPEVAIKFLKNKEFKRTDEKGNLLPYNRQPKQPDELGAGQKFVLADDQTVAYYGELSNATLWQRAAELPGGEKLRGAPRSALIAFIVKAKVDKRNANLEKTARAKAEAAAKRAAEVAASDDMSDGDYDPGPGSDEEMAEFETA